MHLSTSIVILISDLIGCTDRLQFLDTFGFRSDIHVNVTIIFQNETIACVHVRKRKTDLTYANIPFAFHLEQTFLTAVIDRHMMKTTGSATLNVPDAVAVIAQK